MFHILGKAHVCLCREPGGGCRFRARIRAWVLGGCDWPSGGLPPMEHRGARRQASAVGSPSAIVAFQPVWTRACANRSCTCPCPRKNNGNGTLIAWKCGLRVQCLPERRCPTPFWRRRSWFGTAHAAACGRSKNGEMLAAGCARQGTDLVKCQYKWPSCPRRPLGFCACLPRGRCPVARDSPLARLIAIRRLSSGVSGICVKPQSACEPGLRFGCVRFRFGQAGRLRRLWEPRRDRRPVPGQRAQYWTTGRCSNDWSVWEFTCSGETCLDMED
jgi:hypothetical protein